MSAIAHILRRGIELVLVPFDALPGWLALTLLGLLSGAGMLWVVGKVTRQNRLERSRDRMASTIYEVRLYLDSPKRMLLAQGRMLVASARYISCILPAFAILAIPLGLLYLSLEPRFGLAPLATKTPVVIQVDLADGVDGDALAADPEASEAVTITAPPVVDAVRHRVYLRAELTAPVTAILALRAGDQVITKRLAAGADATTYAPDRQSGVASFWAMGNEAPIPSESGIDAISVAHPARPQNWLGLGLPWWLYWLGLATASALALRRPMGVVL